jgi:hypothetical protein
MYKIISRLCDKNYLVQTVEEVRSLEQKVVCTAALSDAERFSEIPYPMESSSNANDCHHQSVAGVKVLSSFPSCSYTVDTNGVSCYFPFVKLGKDHARLFVGGKDLLIYTFAGLVTLDDPWTARCT